MPDVSWTCFATRRLKRFLPLDMTKRDPGAARDSYNEFAQLTSRFPNSRYAPDAASLQGLEPE